MLVTALICNYNYGRYVAEAVDSALSQTWENLEVIVVDDGSTDDSLEVLARYSDRIRVIHKENGGQASAFNVGVAAARGEIICFLDSDDIWHAEKVKRVVRKFQEGSYGLVVHELSVSGLSDNETHVSRALPGFSDGRLPEGDLASDLQEYGYKWMFRPTSALSMATSYRSKVFPLPENEWRLCADTPIAFALAMDGTVGAINETLGVYRYHGQNGYAGVVGSGKDMERVRYLLMRIRTYLFIRKYLAAQGRSLGAHIYQHYPTRRQIAFIAAAQPWRSLWSLAKVNWRWRSKYSRGGAFWFSEFVVSSCVDTVTAALIAGGIRTPLDGRRRIFASELGQTPQEVRQFLLRLSTGRKS